MSCLPAVKIWIWVSALATLAGWLLSLVGQLNRGGYIVFGVLVLLVIHQLRGHGYFKSDNRAVPRRKNLLGRFRRPFPLMFALLVLLVFVGGVIYPPTNHTGLSYRIPRTLHWLASEQWHWIYTPNFRLDTRACGIEWLSAPFLLFLKSDRLLFLLNFIPFLLLPGLIFSTLTRLGVRGRVAWQWMWILPTGYVFLLQAGSVGNDAYPAVYALAAVDFACRAWKSRRITDLWYSLFAIALLGGAKASNLPLTLVWLVLAFPLWRLLTEKPIATPWAFILAALVSFLPTAALNLNYCGSWSGLHMESQGMDMKNPFVGIWGNAFILLETNLCPPFFPMAGWWNQNLLRILPGPIVRPMVNNFEPGFHLVWELPTEDWAGIGAGVSVLVIIAAVWAAKGFRKRATADLTFLGIPRKVLLLALLSPWIALVAYSVKSGMVTGARLIAPYYALLLPLLLVGPEQSQLVRRRWWRALVYLVFLTSFAVLIVTPPRPLWPAKTILRKIVAAHPDNRLATRALATYTAYLNRADPLPGLRDKLPSGLKTIGYLGAPDDLDISFWKPYGSRRVNQIGAAEPMEDIRGRGVDYVIVSGLYFELIKNQLTLEQWLNYAKGEIIADEVATVVVTAGPQHWYLVRLKD